MSWLFVQLCIADVVFKIIKVQRLSIKELVTEVQKSKLVLLIPLHFTQKSLIRFFFVLIP